MNNIKKIQHVWLLMIVLLNVCCSDEPKSEFKLFSDELNVPLFQEPQLMVPQNGCVYHSENSFIATVTEEGKVIPHHLGTTFITVTKNDVSLRCKVNVLPGHPGWWNPSEIEVYLTYYKKTIDCLGLNKEELLSHLGNDCVVLEEDEYWLLLRKNSDYITFIFHFESMKVESVIMEEYHSDSMMSQVYEYYKNFEILNDINIFSGKIYGNAYTSEDCTQWAACDFSDICLFSNQSKIVKGSSEVLDTYINERLEKWTILYNKYR